MKIIGINISSHTDRSHLKALNGGWYNFTPAESVGLDSIVPPKMHNTTPSGFYNIFPNMPEINISCIVGHNGAGKSSLIEIILKIINNFSFASFAHEDEQVLSINWVEGIFAELILEIDNSFFCVRNWGRELFFYKYNNDGTRWDYNLWNREKREVIELLSRFCYTICVNYGIHSFNSNSLRSLEERHANQKRDRWFDKLFHRVDGYQVPLTLVPSRNDGVIDINNEDMLTRQRVSVLSLLMYSRGKKDILNGYTPTTVRYIFKRVSFENSLTSFLRFMGIRNDEEGRFTALFTAMREIWDSKVHEIPDIHDDILESAVNYLTEKTLRICYTYSPYVDFIKGPFQDEHALCHQLVSQIIEDDSYVTSKIKGVLKFLSSEVYRDKFSGAVKVDDILKDSDSSTYNDILQLLPPSFYAYELYYLHNGKGDITLDMLSSGERHLLFTISAVLYHLSNLSSIPTNDRNRIPYHNVNLIFDEAELYFHPEFQRTFIYSLLEKISLLNLDRRKIRGINILLVTHSPFVLSDIPTDNVLFMNADNGPFCKTFGANLYDIMRSGFVVKSGIGELAGAKIRRMFEIYNTPVPEERRRLFNSYKTQLKYLSEEIGDSYLKTVTTRMFDEMESDYSDVAEIDEIIAKTQRRLNELKAKRNERR